MSNNPFHKAKHIDQLFSLKNRVALVTGGAGNGFGKQVVYALAEAGATVIVTSRNYQKAEKRVQEMLENKFIAVPQQLNIADEQTITQTISQLEKKYGSIDILVNNASENCLEPLETISVQQWNFVLQVNITGAMLLSRAVAPAMQKKGKGTIINISSIYGMLAPNKNIYGDSGLNSPLVYGVSKAAIIQMTKYLATYWAPNIRVNCITPGGLFNNQPDYFVAQYSKQTPLNRMANNNDLKGAILLLASDASDWITGQNLIVDGGWSVW